MAGALYELKEALCILECYLDRSGRFLDRASTFYPLPPRKPQAGEGDHRLKCTSGIFSHPSG